MKLFVVSNVGQLNKAQDIILSKKFDNIILCVLYGKNLEILKNIKKQINNEIFMETVFLKLPNKNIQYNKRNQKIIYNMYYKLFQKYNFEEVYLFSFEYHYNYFEDLIRKNQGKLNLIEEGLAMYKPIISPPKLTKNQQLQDSLKELCKGYRIILRNTLKDIKKIISKSAIYKILKINYIFIEEIRNIYFEKKNENYLKLFYSRIKEFDNIYAVFPELLEKKFSTKKYEKIFFDYNILEENIKLLENNTIFNSIDSESIIFINQEYNIQKEIHVDIILSYLVKNYSSEKIYIKFHPRENEKIKETYLKYIKNNNLVNIVCLNLDVEIPLEVILKLKTPKSVIGLTSTSLVYSKEILNNIKSVSIGEYYLKEIQKYENISEKNIKVFKEHLEILKNFETLVRIF